MKLKFKIQPYQTNAVDTAIDCFSGQPKSDSLRYRIDPGLTQSARMFDEGFKNDKIRLTNIQILQNIQAVQKRQNLTLSKSLADFTEIDSKSVVKTKPKSYNLGAGLNLDIEMATGTGKTYCYIKSIFEMHKRLGWSKYIIMVPSIAIREGIKNHSRSPPIILPKVTAKRRGSLSTIPSVCMS